MILKVTSRVARWGRLMFLPIYGCSRSLLSEFNRYSITLTVMFVYFAFPFQVSHALEISSSKPVATAGYYQLKWSGATNDYLLQESRSKEFTSVNNIYQGQDSSTVISGKADGEYFYRITTPENKSKFSNVVKVTVNHHPLENAFLFFIVGAIVFVATVLLIFKGNKKQER